MKNVKEMTDAELLVELIARQRKFSDLRDEEIEMYCNFPNRDCWEDDLLADHNVLLDEIKWAGEAVQEIVDVVNDRYPPVVKV